MKIKNIITALENALKPEQENPKLNELMKTEMNKVLVTSLLNKLKSFKRQPFAVFFQAGAGAPISDFKEEWMAAGLGGCTDELCAITKIKRGYVLINSMTADEQQIANNKILTDKKVDLKDVAIFNDPDHVLEIILNMTAEELKTVQSRKVYIPQAALFNYEGNYVTAISNSDYEPNKSRSSTKYLEDIELSFEIEIEKQNNNGNFDGMKFFMQKHNKKLKLEEDIKNNNENNNNVGSSPSL